MTDLWAALGLALALEGMLYALFPEQMKRLIAQALATPENLLRIVGLTAALIGVAVVWFVRQGAGG